MDEGEPAGTVRGKYEDLPGGDRAGHRDGLRRGAAFRSFAFQPAGARCSSTTSSLPVPGPLSVPEGSPLSYELVWVGQLT
jgi:hypothetical protein